MLFVSLIQQEIMQYPNESEKVFYIYTEVLDLLSFVNSVLRTQKGAVKLIFQLKTLNGLNL